MYILHSAAISRSLIERKKKLYDAYLRRTQGTKSIFGLNIDFVATSTSALWHS